MRFLRLASTGAGLIVMAACSDGREVAGPALPDVARAGDVSAQAPTGAGPVQVAGEFDAIVDFSTLQLTPRDNHCLLDVDGRFIFHGIIDGTAPGHTTALVSATCADVAATPPGTDGDVFTSVATFDGTVAGAPAHATVRYIGRVAPGGHITAHLIFSDGVSGALDADATVAVGGTYAGSLVVH